MNEVKKYTAQIRDVQFGTNPAVQRTIPDRYQVYYASVPNWNGSQLGADIYTIPQPIPVDITYDVTIICNKFRDLNKFNKIILRHFSSRQDYTTIKGHYIPIVLDKIEDNSPIETIDGRRFYVQNYQFTMLGYLIDSEEFEVKPAINRLFTMFEFIKDNPKFGVNKVVNTNDIIQTVNLAVDGIQSVFDVGESIGTLFGVYINDVLQTKNVNQKLTRIYKEIINDRIKQQTSNAQEKIPEIEPTYAFEMPKIKLTFDI